MQEAPVQAFPSTFTLSFWSNAGNLPQLIPTHTTPFFQVKPVFGNGFNLGDSFFFVEIFARTFLAKEFLARSFFANEF